MKRVKAAIWLFFKVVVSATAVVLALSVLLAGAIQLPFIQSRLVNYLSAKVTTNSGYRLVIGHISVDWVDKFSIENVYIYEPDGQQMIYLEKGAADISMFALASGTGLNFDQIRLTKPWLHLKYDSTRGALNLDGFLDLFSSEKPSGDPKPSSLISIGSLFLETGTFKLDDEQNGPSGEAFDENHFSIDTIETVMKKVQIWGDSLIFPIKHMECRHRESGLKAHHLSTRYTYSAHKMLFEAIDFRMGQSYLSDSLAFTFDSIRSFKNFNSEVQLEGHLDGAILHSKDLAVFNSFFADYDDFYRLSGVLKGTVDRMKLKEAKLGFGKGSQLRGDFEFIGLPAIEETFLSLNAKSLSVKSDDLLPYVGYNNGQMMNKLGQIQGQASFTGFINDFVAKGELTTQLGHLVSDVNLKLKGVEETRYSGSLTTTLFDFGKWTDREQFVGKVSMSGKINGEGLNLSSAIIDTEAFISSIELMGYTYQNVKVDANLAKNHFDGHLFVNDSNLNMYAAGTINLEKGKETVDLEGSIQKVNVHKILKRDSIWTLSMQFAAHTKGLSIDSITGMLSISELLLNYGRKQLISEAASLSSSLKRHQRDLRFRSDFASFTMEGNFSLIPLYKDLKATLTEFGLALLNQEQKIKDYYQNIPMLIPGPYRVDFKADLNNLNPVLELFTQEIKLSQSTRINGSIQMDEFKQIQLYSKSDVLSLYGQKYFDIDFDIYASKGREDEGFLVMATVNSSRQKFEGFPESENLLIEGIWNQDKIDFNLSIDQAKEGNSASLEGQLVFTDDGYRIRFDPSYFKVLDRVWSIEQSNAIVVKGSTFRFEQVNLRSGEQLLSVDGVLSKEEQQPLYFIADHFAIDQLSPLLGIQLEGVLNAKIELEKFYTEQSIGGDVNIEGLMINKFEVGNINGKGSWLQSVKKVEVEVDVERNNQKIISISGYVNPLLNDEALQLKAQFREARLTLLEPFLQDYVSDIDGIVKGSLTINGSLDDPKINGNVEVSEGKFKILYLNTTYYFSEKIVFDDQEFGFRQATLRDERGNTAIVHKAFIKHQGFQNLRLDVSASMTEFLVLQKTENLNDYYYGTAVITGTLAITGDFDNVYIKANALSNKGSKIFIPINSAESSSSKDFISFSNPLAQKIVAQKKLTDLSGITMDFNLEFTPEASFEIIFDKRAGDIIKGTGKGKIQMQIDTRGDFTMLGTYEILNGTYNFTFLNVVNKKFDIRSGSKISWNGDAFAAIMDIKASYTQNVSLLPILNISDSNLVKQPEIRRRYPTELFLNLSGPLTTPAFKFDIKISNYPQNVVSPFGSFSLNNAVLAFYSNIHSNEQEMNRQVFSLIALRRLSPDNSFAGSNQLVGNSLTELLSNQLSSWMSQVSDNLEVDIDLNGLSADALSTMQLRLSYSLLNGKIRVTRDGTFTNAQNQTSFNSIIGDWTVEYLIDNYGKLKIKAFNRVNQNPILSNINNTNTAGVSLQHTESFDRLSELISKKRKEEENNGFFTEPAEQGEQEEGEQDKPQGPAAMPARKEEEER
jgi:hypothetical protein